MAEAISFNLHVCFRCKSSFEKLKNSRTYWCPPCNRAYQKKWRESQPLVPQRKAQARSRKKRTDWLNSKKDSPCTDCGNRFPPCCMDFDHLGDKSFGIGTKRMCSSEKLETEIAKCELVCANWHRIRTQRRKHAGV